MYLLIEIMKEKINKPNFYVCSLSGGKDSTAMLLGLLERKMPIDCILFCDTGLEFPAMYDHLRLLEKNIGRSITRIKAQQSYEYLMFYAPVHRGENSPVLKKYNAENYGYSWPGPKQRWCTTRLKDVPREHYLSKLRKQYNVKEYVGIAADEQYRLERKRNKNPDHIHPLVDWGMTEKDCLKYCYEHGYNWDGLYDLFDKVSCWCCPLQSLDELRKLYEYFPELWEQLKKWDKQTWRKFRSDYSVEELEKRFNFEKKWQEKGKKSFRSKEFFIALREELQTDGTK